MNSKKAFLFVIVAFCIFLSGCGNMQSAKTIEVIGLLSGDGFSINIKNRHAPQAPTVDSIYFLANEMNEQIIADQLGSSAEIRYENEGFYIQLYSPDSIQECFYISSLGNNAYILSNMGVSIISEQTEELLLLPLHLISDKRLKHSVSPALLSGVQYESTVGVDAFYAFFENSGWYNTSIRGEKLVISSYKVQPNDMRKDADIQLANEFPIVIEFTEHLGQHLFNIKYESEGQ